MDSLPSLCYPISHQCEKSYFRHQMLGRDGARWVATACRLENTRLWMDLARGESFGRTMLQELQAQCQMSWQQVAR